MKIPLSRTSGRRTKSSSYSAFSRAKAMSLSMASDEVTIAPRFPEAACIGPGEGRPPATTVRTPTCVIISTKREQLEPHSPSVRRTKWRSFRAHFVLFGKYMMGIHSSKAARSNTSFERLYRSVRENSSPLALTGPAYSGHQVKFSPVAALIRLVTTHSFDAISYFSVRSPSTSSSR